MSCLGYDVLVTWGNLLVTLFRVSVAGCLGYDVLVPLCLSTRLFMWFQLLVV
jgi:hypothetical protein